MRTYNEWKASTCETILEGDGDWKFQMNELLRQLDAMGSRGLRGWEKLLKISQEKIQQYSGEGATYGGLSLHPPELSRDDAGEPAQRPIPNTQYYQPGAGQHMHFPPNRSGFNSYPGA